MLFSSTRHGLDLHCSVFHKTVHTNDTVWASSFNKPRRLSIEKYLLGGKQRLRVKPLEDCDRMRESMDCNKSPINTPHHECSRLHDIPKPTAQHNHLDKCNGNFLIICRDFLQLREVCSRRECNNIRRKIEPDVSAIKSFLQNFKTIDLTTHKLYEKL